LQLKSWNRYAYVLNNPLAFIDPLGLNKENCILDGALRLLPFGYRVEEAAVRSPDLSLDSESTAPSKRVNVENWLR
jgi:hypothetical protein